MLYSGLFLLVVSSRPYSYQALLKDLEKVLKTGCARQLATYFALSDVEKERVKHGGAGVLLDILKTYRRLTPENTQDFLHALKALDFNKAAKRVEEYQSDLQYTSKGIINVIGKKKKLLFVYYNATKLCLLSIPYSLSHLRTSIVNKNCKDKLKTIYQYTEHLK